MAQTHSLKLFFDERMRRIFLLGIISGFPWVLIGSSLSLWLKEDGLSRSAVGFAGLIFFVYSINFLWALLIDRLRVPVLTAKFGHRKGWILTMQIIILLSLAGLVNNCACNQYLSGDGRWGGHSDMFGNTGYYY